MPYPNYDKTGQQPPTDPMSGMAEAIVSLHEMFLTARKAGFTEDQALRLIAATMAEMMRNQSAGSQ